MSFGYANNKVAIDANVGGVCASLREALHGADKLVEYLGSLTDADLGPQTQETPDGRGYSETEIDALRAIAAALGHISGIANGREAGAQDNYMFWPKKAIGPN